MYILLYFVYVVIADHWCLYRPYIYDSLRTLWLCVRLLDKDSPRVMSNYSCHRLTIAEAIHAEDIHWAAVSRQCPGVWWLTVDLLSISCTTLSYPMHGVRGTTVRRDQRSWWNMMFDFNNSVRRTINDVAREGCTWGIEGGGDMLWEEGVSRG